MSSHPAHGRIPVANNGCFSCLTYDPALYRNRPHGRRFTVASLRTLLHSTDELTHDENRLERLLQEEAQPENIREGIRRDILTNMKLRDQPILDQYQDKIFRLPLSTQMLLVGAPGTGKTSTLIRRLGQKLDPEALDLDEKRLVESISETDHIRSWILFTPTELLRQYTKEAFAREGIAASDDHITTWDEYRRELARNTFGILRVSSRRRGYVMSESIDSLSHDTLTEQTQWFFDFYKYQAESFWADIRAATKIMVNSSAAATDQDTQLITSLGKRVREIAGDDHTLPNRDTLIALEAPLAEIAKHTKALRDRTDKQIRGTLNRHVNLDHAFLDAMAAHISTKTTRSKNTSRDEGGNLPAITTRAAATAAYRRVLKEDARAAFENRRLRTDSFPALLLQWLGDKKLTGQSRLEPGRKLYLLEAGTRLRRVASAYLDGIPERYRHYRMTRQAEGRWYLAGNPDSATVHPLEVDLLLCAMLFAAGAINRLVAKSLDSTYLSTPTLTRYRDLFRNQVLVDEATDFSPLQLRCMSAIVHPATQSFFACGDFNQRITTWGSRSLKEVSWAVSGMQTRTVDLSYRQSAELHSFATALSAIKPEHRNSDTEAVDRS